MSKHRVCDEREARLQKELEEHRKKSNLDIMALQKQLQKLKEDNARIKEKYQQSQLSFERSFLPAGLEPKTKGNNSSNNGSGQIKCNEAACQECVHIQDHQRHFIENINPIIDVLKGDITKLLKISISMSGDVHHKRFIVQYPEELNLNPVNLRHFKECHSCYLHWTDKPLFEHLVSFIIQQKMYDKRKKNKK